MSIFSYPGYCPICQKNVTFSADGDWYRETLVCDSCEFGSLPRERALALVLEETLPNWRELRIHECSPIWRGISLKIAREAKNYFPSQLFPDVPVGRIVNGFRNEDLQSQTFSDEVFDLVISLDVMEHVFDPPSAIREICRTLVAGGIMIATWPVSGRLLQPLRFRTSKEASGELKHIHPPVYHESIVGDGRSLVTVDYGYDIHKALSEWADFDTRVYRFSDHLHGILGDFTEVIVCRKRIRSQGFARIRKKPLPVAQ